MELDQQQVARRFVRDLNELRQRAGRPSYSTLERLSEHKLRRATMSDVLNGNRVNLPDWRFVALFVAACRAAAQESGLSANDLGTLADWKRHWDSASSGVIDARFPGHASQPVTAPGTVDVTAGAAVAAGPSVWGPVPSRLPDFVGRQAWLEAIHQALASDDRVGVVAVQGLLGVGKTQLAVEYAHRYAHEYDLVWWIPCGSAETAREAMADLAARLEPTDRAQAPGKRDHTALFDVLRQRRRYARWLLVFDNANEPEEIKDLIPSAAGHVLVTTRNSRWEASGNMVELGAFHRAESVEFLRRHMRRFSAAAAHRLAEGVGDLPLLLEHAAQSHLAVPAYLERLDHDPLGLLDSQPPDYQAPIAAEWQAALDQLRDHAAFNLLTCLAFFGSDPIPRESLERGSYLDGVSIRDLLRDPFRRLGAITRLRRAGLLQVDAGTGNFVVHQVTRYVVRNMVAQAGPAGAERARHDVHRLLAAADPLAPDDPATWAGYDELRRHAAESDIAACSHEMVRKFVVNLVRFLNAAGEPRAALDMADAALARWATTRETTANDGAGNAADSQVAMRLAKADAAFADGRRADAFQLRQEALTAMRAVPDRWAAEITRVEAVAGLQLRMAGKFGEAEAADRESVRAHVAEFGDDDPRTFFAVSCLIADLAINGAAAEAMRAADGACRDALAFYSDPRHPAVLAGQNVAGRCLWLSGRPGEAVSRLAGVRAGYEALAGSGTLGREHPLRLLHEIDYAIARRDKGLLPAEGQALADDLHNVRRSCWRRLGANHPLTLAAAVVWASIARRVSGQEGAAERQLADAERRYASALPDHPYAHACTGYLAAVGYQAAHGSAQQAARSVPVITGVVKRLADSVGPDHPLALVAVAALGNALARTGELEVALGHARDALAGFQARLGTGHPHALACEANVVTIRSMLGHEPAQGEQRRLHARYADVVGTGHPDLSLFDLGQLIDIDFTPLPL